MLYTYVSRGLSRSEPTAGGEEERANASYEEALGLYRELGNERGVVRELQHSASEGSIGTCQRGSATRLSLH